MYNILKGMMGAFAPFSYLVKNLGHPKMSDDVFDYFSGLQIFVHPFGPKFLSPPKQIFSRLASCSRTGDFPKFAFFKIREQNKSTGANVIKLFLSVIYGFS